MKHFEKYFTIYQKALDQYESDHPHWRIEVLVSLIKWGLKCLKHYIEDVHDPKITWAWPLVELHYPIDWNWKGRGTGDIAPGGHVYGTFTAENTAKKELAAKTISQMMARQFNAMTLAEATNWAWFEKLNNHYTPIFPVQITADLLAIENKRLRRECYEELIQPFSIGAERIDISEMEPKSRAGISKSATKQPSKAIPSIRLNGEVNGHKFEMGLVFEIHPMIADYDKKEAYHSVVVGLAVLRQTVGGKLVGDTPSDWSKADREQFWQDLYRTVDKLKDRLIPKTESKESEIMLINATLKVPREHSNAENQNEIKKMKEALAHFGKVDELKVRPNVCQICDSIHDAGFTKIITNAGQTITLAGVLPKIVALVHDAHANGFSALSTKNEELEKTCGGYKKPGKAFEGVNCRNEYKFLFDTHRRGFISLHGANRISRNKSEHIME